MPFRAYHHRSTSVETRGDSHPLALGNSGGMLNGINRHDACQLLELLLTVTTEGIFGVDEDGCCVFTNDSAAAILGYRPEALQGRRILELLQPSPDESHFRRPDGSYLPVRVYSYPWNRGVYGSGTIYVFQDLTEKTRMERDNKEAARRYRELFDHVASGVYQSSPEGELLAVNPALVTLLGYDSEQELRAMDAATLYVNPDERRANTARLESDGLLRNVILTLRRKNGSTIRVVENARAVCGPDGRVVYYEGTLTEAVE